jgi:dsRNA-specific ribonuclease
MNAYCGAGTLASITREWGVEVAAAPGGEVDPGLLQYLPTVAGNADPTGTGVLVKEAEQPPKRQKPWNVGLTSRTVQENYFGELDGRTSLDYAERPELQIQDIRARLANGVTFEQAASNFVQAVFGAVYLHGGRAAAKAFFNAHIASRKLDVSSLFAFRQPTRDLSRLCAREGFESPVARIISETGRKSRTPVFVVGVYSGRDKLGEGSGASLEEARTRAAVNALKGWYLYSPLERKVPSDVEGGGGNWEPVLIDGGEVIV